MGSVQLRHLAFYAALLLLPFAAPAVAGDGDTKEVKEDRPTVDATQVYFGKAATCKAPAVVDADRVLRSIAEYKKILDEKLTEADARYSLLMVKATKKFRAAVEGAAKDGSHDLVGNTGSISWPGHDVPDITSSVLQKIEEAEQAGK